MPSMEPPWRKYPEIPRGSIDWRMGRGEEHYNAVYRMFSRLNPNEQDDYQGRFPEPPDWQGWYDMVRGHPWVVREDGSA